MISVKVSSCFTPFSFVLLPSRVLCFCFCNVRLSIRCNRKPQRDLPLIEHCKFIPGINFCIVRVVPCPLLQPSLLSNHHLPCISEALAQIVLISHATAKRHDKGSNSPCKLMRIAGAFPSSLKSQSLSTQEVHWLNHFDNLLLDSIVSAGDVGNIMLKFSLSLTQLRNTTLRGRPTLKG